MIFGLALVALGVIYLLQNLGIIAGDVWKFFWPIILILIGFKILFSHRSMSKKFRFERPSKPTDE